MKGTIICKCKYEYVIGTISYVPKRIGYYVIVPNNSEEEKLADKLVCDYSWQYRCFHGEEKNWQRITLKDAINMERKE